MSQQFADYPPVTDEWTLRLEKLLLEIAGNADKAGKRYFLGCGFGLDVLLGRLTRSHEDLDIFPLEEDVGWWQAWFKSKGFIIDKDPDMVPYPFAFWPTNEQHEYFADVYPVKIAEDGEVSVTCTQLDKVRPWWETKNWNEVQPVIYKGVQIHVENPRSIIFQKLGHTTFHKEELAGKHLHDVELYNRFFNKER